MVPAVTVVIFVVVGVVVGVVVDDVVVDVVVDDVVVLDINPLFLTISPKYLDEAFGVLGLEGSLKST